MEKRRQTVKLWVPGWNESLKKIEELVVDDSTLESSIKLINEISANVKENLKSSTKIIIDQVPSEKRRKKWWSPVVQQCHQNVCRYYRLYLNSISELDDSEQQKIKRISLRKKYIESKKVFRFHKRLSEKQIVKRNRILLLIWSVAILEEN